ncbi:hypothetical protein Tco_0253064 [Tanacetum coccineum]
MVGLSSSADNIVLINNLDVGDPLHIQTNDNSSTTLIPFKLQEESHRGILESSGVSESKLNDTSFAAKSFNNSRRNFNNSTNNNRGFTSNNNVNRGPNPSLNCKNYDITSLKITVGHPNGTLATISHVENLKLSTNVILYDVFLVLGYYDLKRETVMVTGSLIWAKQTMEPFHLSNHKSKTLGELVHLDLWGPYRQEDMQTLGLRRSSMQSKLPAKLNDYVVSSNVKYGIENFVSYSGLNSVNMCFASTLNKSVTPPKWATTEYDVPGLLEEIHVTLAHLEKKRTRLRLYTKSFEEIVHTESGEGVANPKRRRQDFQDDSVRDLVTTSERSRLKKALEESTW